MTLWILKVNGKVHTFRHFLDAYAVATVVRMNLPTARLTLKRTTLPALPDLPSCEGLGRT